MVEILSAKRYQAILLRDTDIATRSSFSNGTRIIPSVSTEAAKPTLSKMSLKLTTTILAIGFQLTLGGESVGSLCNKECDGSTVSLMKNFEGSGKAYVLQASKCYDTEIAFQDKNVTSVLTNGTEVINFAFTTSCDNCFVDEHNTKAILVPVNNCGNALAVGFTCSNEDGYILMNEKAINNCACIAEATELLKSLGAQPVPSDADVLACAKGGN